VKRQSRERYRIRAGQRLGRRNDDGVESAALGRAGGHAIDVVADSRDRGRFCFRRWRGGAVGVVSTI
jgi:hypothetical protein